MANQIQNRCVVKVAYGLRLRTQDAPLERDIRCPLSLHIRRHNFFEPGASQNNSHCRIALGTCILFNAFRNFIPIIRLFSVPKRDSMNLRIRLSSMMFLEYFIWGSWYVTLGTWLAIGLHMDGRQIGLVAGTTAVSAIISPILLGAIADRYFSAQNLLAVLHFVGGILLLFAAQEKQFAT
ncbi:MAG: MFS transporter, partial [Bryocella sp.]